jgi:hypothetical protein
LIEALDRSANRSLELDHQTCGNSALLVLGFLPELSHKPICLYQAQSDPFPETDVQPAANEHRERAVAHSCTRHRRTAK